MYPDEGGSGNRGGGGGKREVTIDDCLFFGQLI